MLELYILSNIRLGSVDFIQMEGNKSYIKFSIWTWLWCSILGRNDQQVY